jgi:hypothetical protein
VHRPNGDEHLGAPASEMQPPRKVSSRPLSATPSERRKKHRRLRLLILVLSCLVVITGGTAVWLVMKASAIRTDLLAGTQLVPEIKNALINDQPLEALAASKKLSFHTAKAREASSDPLWVLAASLPWIGANFSATSEISRSADDVADMAVVPLVGVYGSVQWQELMPGEGQNLASIREAAPKVATAAQAVRVSTERLESIDEASIVQDLASPLSDINAQLAQLSEVLDGTASATRLAAPMLGEGSERNYLLMIQNTAESRATGGIPGALAVLTLNDGKLSLSGQTSAGDMGVFSPNIPTDPEQTQIYSGRLGKFMQDVNLTPDFPSSARIAQTMWEKRTGQRVDGVISIDPVALSYILDATGPITLTNPELLQLSSEKLPTELDGRNVVKTLLSDVYAKIEQPRLQDAYFAGVAQEVFAALSAGKGEARQLFEGMARGATEGRLLIWSGLTSEQQEIAKYPVSGSIAGSSVLPAQFGVYFNDGTGAKMDYYVKRTVQLIKECPRGGYEQTTVRVTSTNTAPADAGASLPAYVTGGGEYGVPPGSVQTNVVAYGPVQSNIETARLSGERAEFAAHIHSTRPVGVVAVRLAPGESKTLEFTFGKIIQHTEPNVLVTPTVQDVKDVVLPTEFLSCMPSS